MVIVNQKTLEITTSQYDYNIPIRFKAYCNDEQGFREGDKIIFVFDTDLIEGGYNSSREYIVDNPEFEFDFALTKEEADSIFSQKISFGGYKTIKYSIKKESVINPDANPPKKSLMTIVDSRIKFIPTLKLEGAGDNV